MVCSTSVATPVVIAALPSPADDPELADFLRLMQPRRAGTIWSNDDVALAPAAAAKGNATPAAAKVSTMLTPDTLHCLHTCCSGFPKGKSRLGMELRDWPAVFHLWLHPLWTGPPHVTGPLGQCPIVLSGSCCC